VYGKPERELAADNWKAESSTTMKSTRRLMKI
jgi:hypothetical protein